MNPIEGEIVAIFLDNGSAKATVRVGRAHTQVSLLLLMDAKVGDRVLIDAGVALSKIEVEQPREV